MTKGIADLWRVVPDMNDDPDTAHGPRSDGRPRRQVSEQSLRGILEYHRKWLESEGKGGSRANLVYADPATRGLEVSMYMYQPLPVVWSPDGPVPVDGVPPLSRVQSKTSPPTLDHAPRPASKFSE